MSRISCVSGFLLFYDSSFSNNYFSFLLVKLLTTDYLDILIILFYFQIPSFPGQFPRKKTDHHVDVG